MASQTAAFCEKEVVSVSCATATALALGLDRRRELTATELNVIEHRRREQQGEGGHAVNNEQRSVEAESAARCQPEHGEKWHGVCDDEERPGRAPAACESEQQEPEERQAGPIERSAAVRNEQKRPANRDPEECVVGAWKAIETHDATIPWSREPAWLSHTTADRPQPQRWGRISDVSSSRASRRRRSTSPQPTPSRYQRGGGKTDEPAKQARRNACLEHGEPSRLCVNEQTHNQPDDRPGRSANRRADGHAPGRQ